MSVDEWNNTWNEETDIPLVVLTPDIPFEVSNQIIDSKIDVDDILSFDNIRLLKNHFEMFWLKSYYDFLYFKVTDFKNICKWNKNIELFIKKIIWRDNYRRDIYSTKVMLILADELWYKELYLTEIASKINAEFVSNWVESLNDFMYLLVKDLRLIFLLDSTKRYFFERVFKKWVTAMWIDDLEKLWKKIWFKYLEDDELLDKIKTNLTDEWITYLDDLDELSVMDFRDLFRKHSLLFYYAQKNDLVIDLLKLDDKETFWDYLWLKEKNKELSDDEKIIEYLKENNIEDFEDLEALWNRARWILWKNELCRKILMQFLLKKNSKAYIKKQADVRIPHIEQFARRIWFEIPEVLEYNEERVKKYILNILKAKWAICMFSLKMISSRWMEYLFNKDNIGERYEDVSSFLWDNNISISKFRGKAFETLWNKIWLKELTELEHKNNLVEFLKKRWKQISDINKARVEDYWDNPAMRYFMTKWWWKSWKWLKPDYVKKVARDIELL